MSFIGSLFNGSQGAGFQATPANVQNPVTSQDVTQSLAQQQANQAQLAGGIQGATGAIDQQQAFVNALNAQNGIQNQSNVYNQLQGVANGTGPNPAQAMLNQQTGANVSQQAALMAGQRGANANVGLESRQAGMQGANIQQQAVGQGATLQANQSLNALGQLQGVAGQQVAQQQTGLGQLNSLQQAQQAAQLQNAQNLTGQTIAGIGGQNTANVGSQYSVNSANAAIAAKNQGTQAGILQNVAGAIPGVGALITAGGANSAAGANGGMVGYANGGTVEERSHFHKARSAHLSGAFKPMREGGAVPGKAKVAGNSYANDTVKAELSPGEIVLPRSVTQSQDPVGNAAKFVQAVMAKHGGMKR